MRLEGWASWFETRCFASLLTMRRRGLRHLLDDLGDLVEDFADLRFGDDQRRAHGDGVAGNAEHDAVVVEAVFERLVAAQANSIRLAGEIDAGHQTDSADIEHVRQTFQPHRRLRPDRLHLFRPREQIFVAVKIERGAVSYTHLT